MGCEACVNCEKCNGSCEICNAETICKVNGSQLASMAVGSFVWNDDMNELSENDIFLTASEWNRFIEKIYKAYEAGERWCAYGPPEEKPGIKKFSQYNGKDIRAGTEYGHEHMTANMYNGAIAKMRYLTEGKGSPPKSYTKYAVGDENKPEGDIITATAFNLLTKYQRETMKLKSDQCDSCNNYCETGNTCDNITEMCADPEPPIDGDSGGGSSGGGTSGSSCITYCQKIG